MYIPNIPDTSKKRIVVVGGVEKFATDLHNPDFAEFANGCGALGIKVTKIEDLGKAMKRVLDYNGTALLEIITDVSLV